MAMHDHGVHALSLIIMHDYVVFFMLFSILSNLVQHITSASKNGAMGNFTSHTHLGDILWRPAWQTWWSMQVRAGAPQMKDEIFAIIQSLGHSEFLPPCLPSKLSKHSPLHRPPPLTTPLCGWIVELDRIDWCIQKWTHHHPLMLSLARQLKHSITVTTTRTPTHWQPTVMVALISLCFHS